MKAQDLYTLGLQYPDSFKLAGKEFIVHSTNPQYAYTKDNSAQLWIGNSGNKVTHSHLIWDMEITDIVQQRKKVLLEYEVLRPNEDLKLHDILEYEDGSINYVTASFFSSAKKIWTIKDTAATRALRRVK